MFLLLLLYMHKFRAKNHKFLHLWFLHLEFFFVLPVRNSSTKWLNTFKSNLFFTITIIQLNLLSYIWCELMHNTFMRIHISCNSHVTSLCVLFYYIFIHKNNNLLRALQYKELVYLLSYMYSSRASVIRYRRTRSI